MAGLVAGQRKETFSEKLFYRIGEVSRITGLEPYVLRYWEKEFPFLRPRKTDSGHRVYTRKDIELILNIKRLLYEEKYTIEGVRKKFGIVRKNNDEAGTSSEEVSNEELRERLRRIRIRLKNLLEYLR